MFSTIWHTFFFDPIYNGLVYFIDVVPGGDVGVAIVLITIVVKLVLLPLSLKAARTQRVMRTLEPVLSDIKKKYKDKREEQAKAMMAAYKDAGVKPFASVLLLFVQIPLIIALYLAVARGGGVPLPDINVDLLYSFVPAPEVLSVYFLGFVDITARNLPLAMLAGLTQFIHARLSIPAPEPRDANAPMDLKADLTRSMQMQMRYVLPIVIGVVAFMFSASIALYFVVSNLMAIGQEYVVKRQFPEEEKK